MRANQKDFCAGLLFIFFGVVALWQASRYAMGTALRMGPGYFPSILGACLVVLGIAIAARSFWVRGQGLQFTLALRPLLLVLGAVVAFSLLIESLGLLLALLALISISSIAGWQFRIFEVTILYVVLAALAVGLFSYFLGLPFKVWPA